MQREEHPDVGWVAALAGVTERRARGALEEAQAERRLFARIQRAHRAGGRPSYIEIDAPLELYAITRLRRPRHVVEVGVSSGVSSAYLLQALARNAHGTLHSVDLPQFAGRGGRPRRPDTASWVIPDGQSSGWAVPMSLRGRWDLRLGDKRAVVPLLADDLPRVDLFVYDVPHSDRDAAQEFRALDRRLSPKGVAIADHGPGGGRCTALQGWAVRRGSTAIRCGELGLYGFRAA
jgi:Methyltransferase domain